MIDRIADTDYLFGAAKDVMWALVTVAGICGACFGAYCLLEMAI